MSNLFPTPQKSKSLFPYAVVGCALGMAAFWLWLLKIQPFYGYVNMFVAPLVSFAQSLIPNLTTAGQTILAYFTANPVAAISAGAVALGTMYTLYSKVQSARVQQEANQQIVAAQTQAIKASEAAAKAETEKKALEEQIKNSTSTNQFTKISSLEAEINKVKEEKATLQTRLNEAQQLFKIKHEPTIEDSILRLKEEGYTVRKTVK